MVGKRLFGCALALALLASAPPTGQAAGGKTPPPAAEGKLASLPAEEAGVPSGGEGVVTEVSNIKTILDQLYGSESEYGPEYNFVAGEPDPLLAIQSDGQKKEPDRHNPKERPIDEMSTNNRPPKQETPLAPVASVTGLFEDVSQEQYFYEAVVWAVSVGITNGTTSTTFSPAKTCTRAQIITFLWRNDKSPVYTSPNPFPDVNPDSDYGKAAHWAYKRGLVLDEKFRGDTPCTRADAVTYLWKLNGGPVQPRCAFTDVPDWESYAYAVAWAVGVGITKGTTESTFSPYTTCTRGQIVTFLYRDFLYKLNASRCAVEGQSAAPPPEGFVSGTLPYQEGGADVTTLLQEAARLP